MKITKYEQSCLKIEKDGRCLLFDVGTMTTSARSIRELGKYDAVIYTHAHPDHFDAKSLAELAAGGATLYGNSDTAAAAGDVGLEVIDDGEELVIADFKIKAVHLEHCLMPNGKPAGLLNTGFLINDQLLIPGDSTETAGIKTKAVALPVFGPDISFKDAFMMAHELEVDHVIPVHFDVVGMHYNAITGFYVMFEGPGEVHALKVGESVTI